MSESRRIDGPGSVLHIAASPFGRRDPLDRRAECRCHRAWPSRSVRALERIRRGLRVGARARFSARHAARGRRECALTQAARSRAHARSIASPRSGRSVRAGYAGVTRRDRPITPNKATVRAHRLAWIPAVWASDSRIKRIALERQLVENDCGGAKSALQRSRRSNGCRYRGQLGRSARAVCIEQLNAGSAAYRRRASSARCRIEDARRRSSTLPAPLIVAPQGAAR